jgi:hypothetical protein
MTRVSSLGVASPTENESGRRHRQSVIASGVRRTLTYSDEAYVMLSEEQIRADGKGIHGLDLVQLNADLASI